MKRSVPIIHLVLSVSTLLWAGLPVARADSQDEDAHAAPKARQTQQDIVIQTIEPDGNKKQTKEVTYLGLAVAEASEALSSQLGLKTGEGLAVTLIAAGSPAAKADFRENDVLVDLDGQMLVHPLQLRKLVQMHGEGDTVKLTFYRAGKKQTISVKLGKTHWGLAAEPEDGSSLGEPNNFQFHFDGLDGPMRGLSESVSRAGLDKAKINLEIKRTMEQTRKAIQDAVRHASTDRPSLISLDRELEDVARGGVDVDKDATVIVRTKRNSSRTIVQTDDDGTIIIEAGARTRLTVSGKDGSLVFEGNIDTPAERHKVPQAVWEKVEPMLNQIVAPADARPKGKGQPAEKPNSRNKMLVGVSYEYV
jgi:hypothetical protein